MNTDHHSQFIIHNSLFTIFALQQILAQLTTRKKIYVAYSGGVDSHVLLHALVSLRAQCLDSDLEITAIHIDHGIHPNSHKWAKHCQQVCQSLKVPCIVHSINVKEQLKKKESLEAIARQMRYEKFSQILPLDAALLTAHHADDQAETVMLQLLRGSGPKGLAAIPAKSQLGQVELLRPLLLFSREEILQYAAQHGLSWVEDVSNTDISIDRNYLRHKVMPLLKIEWRGVLKTLGRAAQNCAEASYLLEILANQDYAAVCGSVAQTLSISKLLNIGPERQRNVIRYWLQLQGLSLSSRIKLHEIQRTILNSASDRLPCVAWGGAEIRRYRDDLYAMTPLKPHDCSTILPWNLSSALTLPSNLGILKAKFNTLKVKAILDVSDITVRFRCVGGKCKPKGRKTHSLKNLFQEWGIPPWQRSRIPLIYQGDKLMVIVGHCICEGWDERVVIEHSKA